jgi:predicted adenine nucleotide alpha hydrolase (AANH) superfamily ATPase
MKVVLHICCGVCAAGVVERLASEGHQLLGLFCNPNIHPLAEYNRRLEVTYRVAKELNFPLEVAPYTPEEWLKETTSLENEPEGGRRCEVCFRLRLKKTCLHMEDYGWDAFTTTLTVSPHKSADVINRVGLEVGGDRFLVRDFKKKEGYKRTTELAKKWGLYRQHYCGCIYSMREAYGSGGIHKETKLQENL